MTSPYDEPYTGLTPGPGDPGRGVTPSASPPPPPTPGTIAFYYPDGSYAAYTGDIDAYGDPETIRITPREPRAGPAPEGPTTTAIRTEPMPGGRIAVYDANTGEYLGSYAADEPSAPAAPVSGGLVETQVPGVYVNPNTGGTVDTRTGETGAPVTGDLVPTQVPGVYVNPNTGSTVDTRTPEDRVMSGDLIPTGQPGVFINPNTGGTVDLSDQAARGTQVSPVGGMPGLYQVRDAAGNIVDVGGTYQDPAKFAEEVRQFDAELARRIQSDQNTLRGIQMQQAGANARNRASLAAEAANVRARLNNDMAIASMDAENRWRISKLEVRLGLRGQNVSAQTAMRGQDVTREGNILQAQQARLQYGMEGLRNDAIAQAIYFTGEDPTGMVTPVKYGLSQFKIPDLPRIGGVSLGGLPELEGMQRGGSVVQSNQPVLSIVGEEVPKSAELALLAPGSVVEPLRLGAGADRGDIRRAAISAVPRLQERARRAGLPGFQEGGAVSPDPQFEDWGNIWNRTSPSQAGGSYLGQTRYGRPVKRLTAEEAAPLVSAEVQKIIAELEKYGLGGLFGGKFGGTTPSPGQQPGGDQRLPPPITLTPEDAILLGYSGGSTGGTGALPTTSADLEAARRTTADILGRSMAGAPMPSFGALPPVAPVFGVNMVQPEQQAARFWRNPAANRNLITSAWGVRNMPQEEFYRRLWAATPRALQGGLNIGYGRHGLAVAPVMRRVAAQGGTS